MARNSSLVRATCFLLIADEVVVDDQDALFPDQLEVRDDVLDRAVTIGPAVEGADGAEAAVQRGNRAWSGWEPKLLLAGQQVVARRSGPAEILLAALVEGSQRAPAEVLEQSRPDRLGPPPPSPPHPRAERLRDGASWRGSHPSPRARPAAATLRRSRMPAVPANVNAVTPTRSGGGSVL